MRDRSTATGHRPAGRATFGTLAVALLASLVTFAHGTVAAAPDGCANAEFRTGPAAKLPNCRAYEMVSPADKNGGSIIDNQVKVSPSGDRISFASRAAFAGAEASTPNNNYLAVRETGRWATRALLPAYTGDFRVRFPLLLGLSEDLSTAVMRTEETGHPGAAPLLDPEAPVDCEPRMLPVGSTGCDNGYRVDVDGGAVALMTPESFPGLGQLEANNFFSGTPGYGRIVFSSPALQAPGPADDSTMRLYEWDHGVIRHVGIDPAGDYFEGAPQYAGANNQNGQASPWQTPPISADGDRIYFSTQSGATDELFLREDASVTHHVSASEKSPPDPDGSAATWIANSRDGTRALFTSPARLVDGDAQDQGADLYLYTHSADPETDENLTLISEDSEPADGLGAGTSTSQTAGIVGISDAGDKVYFVALGQLIAGEPTTPERKLYLWEHNDGSPTLRYLAGLDGGDFANGVAGDLRNWSRDRAQDRPAAPGRWPVDQVTGDGDRMILTTTEPLDAADGDADTDVYRYDATTDDLACLSCQSPGVPSAGESMFRGDLRESINGTAFPSVNVTPDGRRVFFDTADALVPGDANGRRDVYQWEDGALSLISSGQSDDASAFLGASADGDEVFFLTRERLSGWDRDNNTDVYVASVGGGLPAPAPRPDCQADDCQGSPSQAPAAGPPASSEVIGTPSGPSLAGRLRIAPVTLAQRRRLARRGTLALRVRVPRSGRLVVRWNGGRRASARVGRGATKRLTLRLSPRARKTLRTTGRLSVRIVVRLGGSRRTLSFVLRSAK